MSQDIALPVIEPEGPVEDAIDLSAPQRLNPGYFAPPQTIQGPITSDSFINVPFENLPHYISGLTQNVVGFDGGGVQPSRPTNLSSGRSCE